MAPLGRSEKVSEYDIIFSNEETTPRPTLQDSKDHPNLPLAIPIENRDQSPYLHYLLSLRVTTY